MPAKSKKQQKFFGAELARRRQGLTPRAASLSTSEVKKFASTKRSGLPMRAKKRK